ncbi:MAG: CoA transferase [Chromatiales bacterium]|nr:CoA transferase [Chromatiales bacterium]
MGPLGSLRILDFTTLLPGPFASMILADLGADVLRVESPTRIDLARVTPPLDQGGESVIHRHLNRSKRSISLDLKQAPARELIKRLVKDYDVVLEQFRPGVMDRLGLGYEALKAVNPGLIYCSITGYGQDGPYRDRAGHDNNYLALSGIAEGCRHAGESPVPATIQIGDQAGGSLYGLIGLLSAVIHRHHTGQGQQVDVSMTHAAFALNATAGPAALAAGISLPAGSGPLSGGGVYGYYPTRDGRYLSVGSLEPRFRQQLCLGLGREDLLPLALSPRPEDETAFKEQVAGEIARRDLQDWVDAFRKVDACVEPVLDLPEAAASELMQARGMLVDVPMQDGDSQTQIGCPLKFSATAASYRYVGAALGADNESVLKELGLSPVEIKELIESGALGPG